MGVPVNAGVAVASGLVGFVLASSLGIPKFSSLLALISAVIGFLFIGPLIPESSKGAAGAAQESDLEKQTAAKAAKKARKAEQEKAKKEAAEAEKAKEAAAKAAAKKAEKTKAPKGKAVAAPVAVVEPESEEEDDAPKSKSALKKAKAKAKEAAAKAAELLKQQQEAAAAKKAAKKGDKKPAAAAAAAPAAAAPVAAVSKAALAAAAADDGWETVEATKPTKSQIAAKTAVVSPVASTKKNQNDSVPSNEKPLTIDVVIPIKQHAIIIGTKGATLLTLTNGSGAQITMPKRESGSSKIQITGTPDQVRAAKNAIESLAERGFSAITHPGTLSDDINVDPKDIGLILGTNGATLRTIQTKTGARINLPEKGSSSKKVTIVGEKEGVKAAKAALKSLIADGFSPLTHEGWQKLEMQFPAEKFGILIGPKGQTIKSIQGNTKCRINLPDKNTKSTTISIVGLPAGVIQAEKEINRLLEPPAPLPEPEEEDLATDEAWGQEHTAQGEDALWE